MTSDVSARAVTPGSPAPTGSSVTTDGGTAETESGGGGPTASGGTVAVTSIAAVEAAGTITVTEATQAAGAGAAAGVSEAGEVAGMVRPTSETVAVCDLPAVGFIGLGSQGAPIARRIVDAGAQVTLWARRDETLEPFRDSSVQYAESPADLARQSEIVGVCVLDDAGVESVVLGENGVLAGLAPGGILVIHSTVHPDLCERLAKVAAALDVQIVDAPVSGGGPAAERGELVVMTGGDPDAVSRCAPLFALFGDPVLHLGPVGSGQRAKLLNNLMLAANMGVAESTFALARSLNVDLPQLSVLLSRGSGRSYGAALLRGPDFDLAASAAKAGPLLRKDIGLLVDLARSAGIEPGAVLQAADTALTSMGLSRSKD